MSFIQYYLNEIMTFLSHEKKVYTTLLRSSPEGGNICDRSKEERGKYLHSVPTGRITAGRHEHRRRSLADKPELPIDEQLYKYDIPFRFRQRFGQRFGQHLGLVIAKLER